LVLVVVILSRVGHLVHSYIQTLSRNSKAMVTTRPDIG
jgi:hypothetical protein